MWSTSIFSKQYQYNIKRKGCGDSLKWSPKGKCFDVLLNSFNYFLKLIYGDYSEETVSRYWSLEGEGHLKILGCFQMILFQSGTTNANTTSRHHNFEVIGQRLVIFITLQWLPVEEFDAGTCSYKTFLLLFVLIMLFCHWLFLNHQ